MADTMWDGRWGLQRLLPREEARQAVREALKKYGVRNAERADVWLVCCTGLFWRREYGKQWARHVGTHPYITAEYMKQDGAPKIARKAWEASWRAGPDDPRVLAFWCNAGEHRSVAMAESYGQVMGCDVIHLCKSTWRWRSCGCCQECDPARQDEGRSRAWAQFRAWMK